MDIWDILGIEPTADAEAIKKAYARQAKKCHPEVDPERFQALHQAYITALRGARKNNKNQAESKGSAFRASPENLRELGFDNVVEESDNGSQANDVYQFPVAREEQGTDQQTNGLLFPKGQPYSEPGQLEEQDTPGYSFVVPKPQAPGHESATNEQTTSYSFPNSGGQQETAIPKPGKTEHYCFSETKAGHQQPTQALSPSSLIFPNTSYTDGDMFNDMRIPFLPLLTGATEESFPQTRSEAENLRALTNARAECLEAIQALCEQQAGQPAWLEFLQKANFTITQYDSEFLRELLEICRLQLSLPMASPLYMAYGFASSKSAHPLVAMLYKLINQLLQLPQDDIPLNTLSEILQKSDTVLASLARLHNTCNDPYICEQVVRTPIIRQVKYQPYFIERLLIETNNMGPAWLQAWAKLYAFSEETASPCLGPLAKRLPVVAGKPKWAGYNPDTANLLLDENALEKYMSAMRNNIIELLHATLKGFAKSTRRNPWDFIFTHNEFIPIMLDELWLDSLLAFLQENKMPVGLWPALADGYAQELTGLADDINLSTDELPSEKTKDQLARLQSLLQQNIGRKEK